MTAAGAALGGAGFFGCPAVPDPAAPDPVPDGDGDDPGGRFGDVPEPVEPVGGVVGAVGVAPPGALPTPWPVMAVPAVAPAEADVAASAPADASAVPDIPRTAPTATSADRRSLTVDDFGFQPPGVEPIGPR